MLQVSDQEFLAATEGELYLGAKRWCLAGTATEPEALKLFLEKFVQKITLKYMSQRDFLTCVADNRPASSAKGDDDEEVGLNRICSATFSWSPPADLSPRSVMPSLPAASHPLPPEGEHGPFNSLQELLNHAAHLAIFLNYVILNKDPAPLLFYLVTDAYKAGSVKEMRKWAYEIHFSFLVTRGKFLSSIHSTDSSLRAPLELPNLESPTAGRVGRGIRHGAGRGGCRAARVAAEALL